MPPKQQQAKQVPKPASQGQNKDQQSQVEGNGEQQQEGDFEPAFSEEEQNQERSKAASQSLEAKKKARYYIRAAAGAGDSKERQKLLKEALNKEVEAESFGKLAKWLNSGALQGFAAGSIPAASLGALTGTLVGGVTSLITGGLGAGIGYLKGPAYSVGGVAASGVQKVMGDKFEWNPDATEEQQQAVENMCGQIQDEDMPDDEELEMFSAGEWSTGDGIKQGLNEMHDGRGKTTQSWSSYAASWVPGQQAMESVPGYSRFKGSGQDQQKYSSQKAQANGAPKSEAAARSKAQGSQGKSEAQNEKERSRSQQVNTAANDIRNRVNQPQKGGQRNQPVGASGNTSKPQQATKQGGPKASSNKSPSASNASKPKSSAPSQSQSPAPRPKGKPRKLELQFLAEVQLQPSDPRSFKEHISLAADLSSQAHLFGSGERVPTIACNPCGTAGELHYDFDIDRDGLSITASVSLTPVGVGAEVTAKLAVEEALSEEASLTMTLFSRPIDGIKTGSWISIGPLLSIDLLANVSKVTAKAQRSAGVKMTVPDDSLAVLSMDSDDSTWEGWTFDLESTLMSPDFDTSVSISASAGLQIRADFEIYVDAKVIGKKGLAAGLVLDAPVLALNAAAKLEDGACENESVDVGVDVNAGIGGRLAAFVGTGKPADLPNKFDITSVTKPIYTTSIAVTDCPSASAVLTISSSRPPWGNYSAQPSERML